MGALGHHACRAAHGLRMHVKTVEAGANAVRIFASESTCNATGRDG